MKRRVILFLLLLIAHRPIASETIELYSGERVITEADSPLVVRFVYIDSNAVLRLEPGAHLIILPRDDDSDHFSINGGQLIAHGTADKPVRIEHARSYYPGIVLEGDQEDTLNVSLDHVIWDLGSNRLRNQSAGMIVRNSTIKSSIYRQPASYSEYFESAAMVFRWGEHRRCVFEDTLFVTPHADTMRVADYSPTLEFRRCVFTAGSFARPGSAIEIRTYDNSAPRIIVEDSRFSGFESPIRIVDIRNYFGQPLMLTISGSDLSEAIHSIYAEYQWMPPTRVVIRDSHLMPMFFGTELHSAAEVEIVRTSIRNNGPPTTIPSRTVIHDPATEANFRHADLNGDGRTDDADVEILQAIVAGDMDPESLTDPSLLDIDADGIVDMRDLALLKAYVDGAIVFLPRRSAP